MGERRPRGAEAEEPTYSVAARRLHWWTVLFLAIRVLSRLQKEAKPEPATPSAEVVLLTEIRDLLKK